MAEQKLLGQSCAIQATLGGKQSAGAPVWANAATSVKCRLRTAKIDNQAVTVDVSTLCDEVEQIIVKRRKATIELEMDIPLSGPMFVDEDGPLIGVYARIQMKNLASLANWRTWEGVITAQSEELPDGEQIERVTIMIGASGIDYASGYAAAEA